jgi:hypothetical protein
MLSGLTVAMWLPPNSGLHLKPSILRSIVGLCHSMEAL